MSEEKPRWEEVAGKLAFEKIELDREIERQRMLDELSASRSRNYELEGALAKLARDQDRVALAERERVLKRAQIAQATAVLVQEAQWAKARMESEMRVAKNRAMVFPDSEARRPTVNSRVPQVPVASVPADSPPTPSLAPPMVVPNSVHSSSSDGVIFSKPSFVVDSSSTPPVAPSEGIDSLAAAVAETSNTVMTSAGEFGGMLSSAFTDVASMFGNSTEPAKLQNPQIHRDLALQTTTKPTSQKLPVIVESSVSGQHEEDGANTVSAPESTRVNQEVTSMVSEDLPHSSNVNAPLNPKPPAVPKSSEPLAQASTTFPARSAPTQEESKKYIQQRAKGAWTNMGLHAEAGLVLEQLIKERDSTIQKKPELIERLFAIPDRSARAHVEYPMQPDWLKIADSWAKSASVEPSGKSGAKSRIDPVIASMAGVDPNLGGQENIKPDQTPPDIAKTPPPVEDPSGDSNRGVGDGKKKKCIIM